MQELKLNTKYMLITDSRREFTVVGKDTSPYLIKFSNESDYYYIDTKLMKVFDSIVCSTSPGCGKVYAINEKESFVYARIDQCLSLCDLVVGEEYLLQFIYMGSLKTEFKLVKCVSDTKPRLVIAQPFNTEYFIGADNSLFEASSCNQDHCANIRPHDIMKYPSKQISDNVKITRVVATKTNEVFNAYIDGTVIQCQVLLKTAGILFVTYFNKTIQYAVLNLLHNRAVNANRHIIARAVNTTYQFYETTDTVVKLVY